MEIEIPRIPNPRVLKHEIKLAKYVLMPFGLASDTVGDITIDTHIALIQPHPDPELYLCPLVPNPQPDLSTVWFYADCIAFDHDIPVIVSPTHADIRRFGFRYIYTGTHKTREITTHNVNNGTDSISHRKPPSPEALARLFFNDQLNNILSEIRDLHHGPLTCIEFRHDGWHGRVDLPYTQAYSLASQEIHLYSTALRQADTLSEYLSYYRVIESASNSNGKSWIASVLLSLYQHRFDIIPIGLNDERETANLMAIYRRRALRRLKFLLGRHQTPTIVADYLYNVNRCGIAHGRRIIRADITPSYFEMVKDTYLVKLLARLAIDEKLGSLRI
jgi:hypothetical protein